MEGLAANQVLIQQTGVAENPHRHEAIHGGLEFQQQIHIQPVIPKPHPPDDSVVAVARIIGHRAGVDLLQRREIQRLDPGPRRAGSFTGLGPPPQTLHLGTGLGQQPVPIRGCKPKPDKIPSA